MGAVGGSEGMGVGNGVVGGGRKRDGVMGGGTVGRGMGWLVELEVKKFLTYFCRDTMSHLKKFPTPRHTSIFGLCVNDALTR